VAVPDTVAVEGNSSNGQGAARIPLVALLRVDRDLADGLSESERAEAERRVLSPVLEVRPGAWSPGSVRPTGLLTMLLIEGFLAREVELGGRRFCQLFGPGAPVDPWVENVPDGLHAVTWKALTPARLVVIEERFARAALAWPALLEGLMRRTAEWAEHLTAMSIAAQRPRMDLRILTAMWHLAQRWGKVTSEGILLDLPLTHETLGAMLGSRRPTVTLALNELTAAGLLERRADGSWLLSASARTFTGDAAPERDGRDKGHPGPGPRNADRTPRGRAAEAAARSALLHDGLADLADAHGDAQQAQDHRAWARSERLRAARYEDRDSPGTTL
jgi:CRP/FNR family transcriptional regulator, cyclic AMP receptor protein